MSTGAVVNFSIFYTAEFRSQIRPIQDTLQPWYSKLEILFLSCLDILGGCLACCSTAVSQLYCNFQDGISYIWNFEIFYGCMRQRSKDCQRPTGESRSPDVENWFGWPKKVLVDRSKCEHPDCHSMLAFRSVYVEMLRSRSGAHSHRHKSYISAVVKLCPYSSQIFNICTDYSVLEKF